MKTFQPLASSDVQSKLTLTNTHELAHENYSGKIFNTFIQAPFYNDSGANRFVVADENLLSDVRTLNPPEQIGVFDRSTFITATKICRYSSDRNGPRS